MGSICWFSWRAATSCALCTASWALTVIFSNRNITTSFPMPSTEKGRHTGQPSSLTTVSCELLPCGSGHRRGCDVDLDLLGLGSLTLRDRQRQHAVLVIRLDRFSVDGVRQRETPREGTIGTLDTQALVFVHLLLELALPANRQNVVLHANIQILGINVREIGFHHQLVLGLVDIYRRSPRGEAAFLAGSVEGITEQTIDLVLKCGQPALGFPPSNYSHF